MRALRVAAVLLGTVSAWPAHGQTLEEVRRAVDDYFADDAAEEASHAALQRWGSAAIPFLRELAGKPDDVGLLESLSPVRRGDWDILCAIQKTDAPEATDLLVEILDGKTAISAAQALDTLQMLTGGKSQLCSHLRFQQLVFKFAKDERGSLARHYRGVAAGIIANCGWEDGEPLLELMLQDEDLSLREDAAKALTKLTGRTVEVSRPHTVFPHAADREELVLIAEVPNDDVRGRFDFWFDGQAALIMDEGLNLEALDRHAAPWARLDPGFDVADLLSLRRQDGTLRWVFLGDVPGEGWSSDPAFAVCVDADRHEIWRYTPPRAGIETMCRLYDASGCIGVAFGPGGEEGVVAFDHDGRELFRVPRRYVTYELSSNPRIPGLWLHCGGNLELYDNRGQAPPDPANLRKLRAGVFYALHAVLAVNPAGEPVIVAAGSSARSVPSIQCLDAEQHLIWSATLSDRPSALALLEPPDRAALLAATTAAGDLLIFDLDGGLHRRLKLAAAGHRGHGGNVHTYSISAGPLSDGGYGLAVGLLGHTALYALR